MSVSVLVTAFVQVDSDPVPGMTVVVETRASASLPWRAVDTISVGATGTYALNVGGADQYVRITWGLVNLTSITFSASAVAQVTYCDPADITKFAVPEASIEEIGASDRVAACLAVTDVADGYVGGAYTLPLTAWGTDLRLYCAQMAAAHIFRVRGMDPEGPDKVVFDAEANAIKWLDRLANGRLSPPGMVDSTPEVSEGGSVVVSRPMRGW